MMKYTSATISIADRKTNSTTALPCSVEGPRSGHSTLDCCMALHLQERPGTDEADDRQGCPDGHLECADALARRFACPHIPREIRVARRRDQLDSPFLGVPVVAVGQRAVSGARGGGVDQRIPDVEYQGELDDREEERGEQRTDQHEVHHCSAPFYALAVFPAIGLAPGPPALGCHCLLSDLVHCLVEESLKRRTGQGEQGGHEDCRHEG